MKLCCEGLKAKLRNYVTISTNAKLCSGASKIMYYGDAPPPRKYLCEVHSQLELSNVLKKE